MLLEGLIIGSELMLRGFAIECLLKGLWVKRGHELASEGEYLRPPGVAHHDLVGLDSGGEHAAGREADRILLRRLSRYNNGCRPISDPQAGHRFPRCPVDVARRFRPPRRDPGGVAAAAAANVQLNPDDIPLINRTRNDLVHRGRFATEDPNAEFRRVLALVDRLVMGMLGYRGP